MKKNIGKYLMIVLPIVAGLWLLYPTYDANELQKAKDDVIKEATGKDKIDSLKMVEDWKEEYGSDLEDARSSALKLGLDLRGGMYVTLEVDIVKLIDETAQKETKDQIFDEVIVKTESDAKDSDEAVLDIFLRNFEAIAKPKGKSLINYFDIGDFRDASEDRIVERLQNNIDGAVDLAIENIRQRVDAFGVTEPTIQKQGTRRILLELPGVKDEKEMRQYLQKTARLEFNLVRNNKSFIQKLWKIDQVIAKRQKLLGSDEVEEATPAPEVIEEATSQTFTAVDESTQDTMTVVENDTTEIVSADTTKADTTANPYEGLDDEAQQKLFQKKHPFSSLFGMFFIDVNSGQSQAFNFATIVSPETLPDGRYNFIIDEKNLDKLQQYLELPEVKQIITSDLRVLREANPIQSEVKATGNKVYYFYAVKAEPELTGDVIVDARADFDPQTNQPTVTMAMNSDGAERWARITGANVNKRIAIILDDWIYTAPNVIQKITGGNSRITGMADTKEATLIQNLLKAGALKTPVKIIEERVVGPSLGEDSINAGFMASMIAFVFVILYMAIYYSRGGLIADFAVVLNVFLLIGILAGFGGTLTLPGIAGIILTIGMAVDANVLIFERVREELKKGRSLRSAVDEGYTKALSAILDSNITTLATAAILYFFGSGPIQGFALTLMIGIFMTLFTAIIITRQFVEISLSGGASNFSFGQPKLQD